MAGNQRNNGKLLEIRGLEVKLPDGELLFGGLNLEVSEGSIVTVVGGSGSGKTTLIRVLFEADELDAAGYQVRHKVLKAWVPLGLVPQNGAPFDHLDVAGNLQLALRHAEGSAEEGPAAVKKWLARVDLPRSWATQNVDASRLSGGQVQRLAVARTLAGGRRLLFLDEPSASLDPYRVQLLGQQLRALCAQGTGMVLVTHDVALAGAVSDQIFILGRDGLADAFDGGWPGPLAERHLGAAERVRLQHELEQSLVAALKKNSPDPATPRQEHHRKKGVLKDAVEPLGVAAVALEHQPPALRFPPDYAHVFGRVLTLAVLRPSPFYGIVSLLLGFTFLFTMTHVVPEGVAAAALVRQIGGSYVTALAPALSAFLFVAASGNAVNAWIGGMGLTRQIAALEALGIQRENYLWAPTWLALALSYLLVLVVFALGLLLGGLALCRVSGIHDGWIMLSSEFLDPRPGRRRFLVRALWLSFLYAVGIAADVVQKANREKPSAESVTRAMTSSVVASTLWVVTLELVSALWIISTGPRGQD